MIQECARLERLDNCGGIQDFRILIVSHVVPVAGESSQLVIVAQRLAMILPQPEPQIRQLTLTCCESPV